MTLLPVLPSGAENSDRKLNPKHYSVYKYFSGSAFLVRFTAPNKQYFRRKSMVKSRDDVSNSQTINKFTTFFGVKGALFSYFQQLPSNSNLILDSFCMSYGERLLFVV